MSKGLRVRLKNISLVIAVLSGLSACGTTPKTASTPDQQTLATITTAPAEQLDAQGLFDKASRKQGASKIQLLYLARQAAIDEQNWPILEKACSELESKASVDHVQNKLYTALARQQQQKYSSALALLQTLESKLKLPEHQAWHQYLMGSVYAAQQLPKKALVHYFNSADLANKHQLNIAGLNQDIWQALQQLSSYALERFDRGTVVQQGWVKLAKYHQIYLGSTVQLHQALNNWQRRYTNHPGSEIIPTEVKATLDLAPYEVTRLAVLLPASGNSERLGRALKNGFLAAMDNNRVEEIFFIDETLDVAQIDRELQQSQADFVIGPLLKSNVERLTASTYLTTTPALFLNTLDAETQPDNPNHYYFALDPEHEVEQAMVHFLAKGYQKPMLLAPDTASGKRLINHFETQWQRYSETQPEVGFYSDSENMAQVVRQLLEVDSSKQRIATIKRMFRRELESETRSRRDIDAIYILGDAIETRLLKPYLDVNVSTFADRIPLYASSRSYSKQIDKTDKGDLDGLFFTEVPWMLPGAVKSQSLREQHTQLWPEQSDIEQRLFAMAYDALNLIPEVKQLSKIPGKEFDGLTGSLTIKEANRISRQLSWAQYHKKQIRLVSLDQRAPTPLFMKQLYDDYQAQQ